MNNPVGTKKPHKTFSGLNQHRAAYYEALEQAGYPSTKIIRPIAELQTELKQQLIDDLIFYYRSKFDRNFAQSENPMSPRPMIVQEI